MKNLGERSSQKLIYIFAIIAGLALILASFAYFGTREIAKHIKFSSNMNNLNICINNACKHGKLFIENGSIYDAKRAKKLLVQSIAITNKLRNNAIGSPCTKEILLLQDAIKNYYFYFDILISIQPDRLKRKHKLQQRLSALIDNVRLHNKEKQANLAMAINNLNQQELTFINSVKPADFNVWQENCMQIKSILDALHDNNTNEEFEYYFNYTSKLFNVLKNMREYNQVMNDFERKAIISCSK